MTTVKRGYDTEGYVADADLAAFVIEQLARAGLKVRQLVPRDLLMQEYNARACALLPTSARGFISK